MSNLLAIETSSSVLSLALQTSHGKVSEKKLHGYMGHVEHLIPLMDELLREAQLTIQQIDAFLIDQGPGSFTGLRVGFSTLKALSLIQKKPCMGAMSVDLIAESIALPDQSNLTVALDAHREKIYARTYQRIQGNWQPIENAGALSPEALAEQLTAGSWIAGNALIKYKQRLASAITSKSIHVVKEDLWTPSASGLLSLWTKHSPLIRPLVTPMDFVPVYLRASEAEEKRNSCVTPS